MSNTNQSVEQPVYPGQTSTVTSNGQVKVSYEQMVKSLEKQHKLLKLQCEIAMFRAKELEANLFWMNAMSKYNAAQNAPEAPETPNADPAPKTTSESEEKLVKEPSY